MCSFSRPDITPVAPHIRAATGDDVLTVVQIYVDSWNKGFVDLMPQREIAPGMIERWHRDLTAPPPHHWWVAELDSVIVGFVGIGPNRAPDDRALGELDTIAVAPHMWRRGIGHRLMGVATEHLKRDGYAEAILWTLANYPQGQRFYEGMGWSLDGATRDGGRQVRYHRRLG